MRAVIMMDDFGAFGVPALHQIFPNNKRNYGNLLEKKQKKNLS